MLPSSALRESRVVQQQPEISTGMFEDLNNTQVAKKASGATKFSSLVKVVWMQVQTMVSCGEFGHFHSTCACFPGRRSALATLNNLATKTKNEKTVKFKH